MSGSGTGIVTPYNTHRALDFDGAADSYTRGADLIGNAVSQLLTMSLNFRVDGGNGAFRVILDNTTSRFVVLLTNTNKLRIRGQDGGGVSRLDIVTTPAYLAGSGWHNVMVSCNLATPVSHIYVDGAIPALDTNTASNLNSIDFTRPAWSYGDQQATGLRWNGGLSEGYFNFAEYVDLAVQANRYLLRHPNGQPPNILADGSGVTGTQPIMYMVEEGGVLVDRGSGGAFAAVGAPALSADSPKDRWVSSLNYGTLSRLQPMI